MRIIAVDTDKKSLDAIRSILEKTAPDSTVYYFDDPRAALAKAREEEIDVAFLEVLMSELSGIDLGKYLVDLNPHVNLVYISEHTDKAFEALQIHASGFLKKPGTEGAVSDEMANLRYPEISKKEHRLRTVRSWRHFGKMIPIPTKSCHTFETSDRIFRIRFPL